MSHRPSAVMLGRTNGWERECWSENQGICARLVRCEGGRGSSNEYKWLRNRASVIVTNRFVAKGLGPALSPLQVPAFNETEDTSPMLVLSQFHQCPQGAMGPWGPIRVLYCLATRQ